ncbi:MAG: hypothetical protein LBR32_07470 [Propionibacteriaceae bacterium]|jgi:hypothetical protein|nr:hypothetical protein [Propionibacteriaceae bacterium]
MTSWQALEGRFRQPDATTCGSSCLVMARMLLDADFATRIVDGRDPATGARRGGTAEERFAAAAADMHARTNAFSFRGGFHLPWPKALGTTPAAVARQLARDERAAGLGPSRRRVRWVVAPSCRDDAYGAVLRAVRQGWVAPVFCFGVGANLRHCGAHVVLAVAADGDDLRAYEPQSGRVVAFNRSDFTAGTLSASLGWDWPLAVVLPGLDRPPTPPARLMRNR